MSTFDTEKPIGNMDDESDGSGGGAIWILFLNTDGTVKNQQKISATPDNFTGILNGNDKFGRAT